MLCLSDLPYDIHLSIVNRLPIDDARNLGKYIENDHGVGEYLLQPLYMVNYLKTKVLNNTCHYILRKTTQTIHDTIKRFKESEYKPMRLNTTNGTIYTLHPDSLNHSFFISNITVPDIPDKAFTFSFHSLARGVTEIYYGGLDVLVIVIDNCADRVRNVLVRIPYHCEDHVYGFAASATRLISGILRLSPMFADWKVRCEYMLCRSVGEGPYVRAVSAKYNTRHVDSFYHRFMERLLHFALEKNGYEFSIRPWDPATSVVKKEIALMRHPPYVDTAASVEEILQGLGFPNNAQVKTDVYLNPQTQSYYEVVVEEVVGENEMA